MILKKLRDTRKLSQEQLAIMAGLSVRTIQRIEYGHKASLETLKALASVLEVDLSLLEQEIDVIDKAKEETVLDRPRAVTHAVIAIYGTLIIAAIGSISARWIGEIPSGSFVLAICLYSILCIVPYKIGNGSNATRYVFLVMAVSGLLLTIGDPSLIPAKSDWVASLVSLPVEAYALFCLFGKEANRWFSPKSVHAAVST